MIENQIQVGTQPNLNYFIDHLTPYFNFNYLKSSVVC